MDKFTFKSGILTQIQWFMSGMPGISWDLHFVAEYSSSNPL